ncbi:MAG: hypothetical protein P9M15_02525 [Candidatus Electryoneaceae bacterium]|nr:hypothetical protein [Candidatus Electryoneaceae bacterium]
MIRIFLLTGWLWTVVISLTACDAPHDNPFDPNSSAYQPIESPVSVNVSASSIHCTFWWIDDKYYLSITAEIEDPDGVDSVWVGMDELDQAESFNIGSLRPANRDSTLWLIELEEDTLMARSGWNLEALVGHRLSLLWKNETGTHKYNNHFHLKRVIYPIPDVSSPDYDTTLTTRTPIMEWQQFESDFNYTYSLKISHVSISNFETVIYQRLGIASDRTTHQVEAQLPLVNDPEFLYWIIEVVDDFGDIARSSEARFRIIEDE